MGLAESKTDQNSSNLDVSIKDKGLPAPELKTDPVSTPELRDPRSPSDNISRTPLELSLLGGNLRNQLLDRVILGEDPRSPTVDFERTPIVIGIKNETPKLLDSTPISRSLNSQKRKSMVGVLETNLDFRETDLDSVIKMKEALNRTLPSLELEQDLNRLEITEKPADLDLELKSEKPAVETEIVASQTEKTVNITLHVNNFDKKLTNLIYQDEIVEECLIKVAKVTNETGTNNNQNCRTPLGVRNKIDEPKRGSHHSQLKVSDKPRNLRNRSRIPVSKDVRRKIQVQCENTPPKCMGGRRTGPKWDGDNTLII